MELLSSYKLSYLFLETCLILLFVHTYEQSSFALNDLCSISNGERMLANYTFFSAFPAGGLKSVKHTRFNNTDQKTCIKRCCDNKECNAAWNYNLVCLTFQCNLTAFEKCLPKKLKKSKLSLATLFILRSPMKVNLKSEVHIAERTQSPSTATTVMKSTTTIPSLKILTIDISKNQTLTMPNNSVTLIAKVRDDKKLKYEYQWTILSKPSKQNSGKMDNSNTNELKLSDLIIGAYQIQVDVHGNNSYGKANVSVFVKPELKLNMPPVAKIIPKNQIVQLPNNVILDGSKSSDDVKVVSFNWELVKGPIDTIKNMVNGQSMLNLEQLTAGNYTFKLTVKDAAGATSFDMATMTVLAEKDFPPQADPGKNVIVELPVKYVILNGSLSRDDKKIVSYQWTKKSDGLTADMQGVREPILNLTNLQEGTYVFNLKVTDSAAQYNDKDIQVFVKPRTNSPPIAKASVTEDKLVKVGLPATEAVLNGSLSSDDELITKYLWQQIEGQPKLNLQGADKPIAYVYDLKIGIFKFKLTVYDKEKLSNSDIVTLRINENKNQKPEARIQTIPQYHHFETNIFRIDGSKSWDDVAIVQYKWTREDDSLAVGQVLENSDSSAVLMLTDLLPGSYKFKLEVFDVDRFMDSSIATFEVQKSKYEINLVELQFLCSHHQFTESKKNAFLNNIQLIIQKKLDSDSSKVVIHLVQLDAFPFENSVTIVFYVTLNKETQSTSTRSTSTQSTANNSSSLNKSVLLNAKEKSKDSSSNQIVVKETFIDALKIVDALDIVRRNPVSIEYQVVRVETYVCQNNCSHHGICNEVTKLCECETFWTSSYIRDKFGDGRPNCDWSIIYLSIFFAMSSIIVCITCWFFLWIRQRRCKTKKSIKMRKHKYMKLEDYDYEDRNNHKVPKSLNNGTKLRSNADNSHDFMLNSDSCLSSEEETTMFINTNHMDDHSPVKKPPLPSIQSGQSNNGIADTMKTS